MTVPALALVPVLISGRGTRVAFGTLDAELLARAGRDDYQQWLATAMPASGCVRPIRLAGQTHDVDSKTGEILSTFDTSSMHDRVIYTACGDRRASVCPSCAETYRRDTYQLIRAGLVGGKGVPESVSAIKVCASASPTPKLPSFKLVASSTSMPSSAWTAATQTF